MSPIRPRLASVVSLASLLGLALPPSASLADDAESSPAPCDDCKGWEEEVRDAFDFHVDIGPLRLAPTARVQVQAVPFVGDDAFLQSGDIAENAGFRLRRARFGIEGNLYGYTPFAVSTELSSDEGGKAELLDAWLGYTPMEAIQVFAGADKVPFSRSEMLSSRDTSLIERPLAVRAMAPARQVGVRIEGHLWDRALSYYAGVYNGFQRHDFFFEGFVENGASFGNRFDEFAYAVRLASEPLGPIGRSVADLDESPFRLALGGDLYFSNGGTRDLLSASGDLHLKSHGFHLLAEFLWSKAEAESKPSQATQQLADITSMAATAEVGYVLMRRFGATVRFEWFDPNDQIDDEGDSWAVTGGLTFHWVDNLIRTQLEFTHREELEGLNLDNDSFAIQLQVSL